MDVVELKIILTKCLRRFLKKKKKIFLLEDFNINVYKSTNDFLDSLDSKSVIAYILKPTRLISHSKTLINNIFSNMLSSEIISGNLTATISDHLHQFLVAPDILSNTSYNKSTIFERDWSKFNHENFMLDYVDQNWSDVLQID